MTESMSTLPPPVTLAGLRNHFSTTYQLESQQVELMVSSSRRSLEKIFSEAGFALDASDSTGKMVAVCHSLKGLLLNMGAPDWANVAKELEKAAREGKSLDYRAVLNQFREGMAEILADAEGPVTA